MLFVNLSDSEYILSLKVLVLDDKKDIRHVKTCASYVGFLWNNGKRKK